MARIPGIKFEKDAKGNNRYVRIDLKKHAEAIGPFLKKLSQEDDYDEEFEKEWAKGISGDELVKNVTNYIRTLPWKR